MTDLLDAMRTLREDEAVRLLDPQLVLEMITESRPNLTASKHPLGFLHLDLTPLVAVAPGETFRLHYWPIAGVSSDAAGNVHDHVWNLTSVVLMGELRNRNFQYRPNSAGRWFGARVTYGRINTFASAGRFDLDLESDEIHGEGHIYRIPPGVVHESEVVRAPTVTLVRAYQDPTSPTLGPIIFGPDETSPLTGTPAREAVKADILYDLITQALA